jgi:rhodanese-related sulfurtransferase
MRRLPTTTILPCQCHTRRQIREKATVTSQPNPSHDAPTQQVAAEALVALLAQPNELAVLDVRELGVHDSAGHILLSVPLPLSRLELRIAQLVPRRDTRIVVYDGGTEGLAARAAQRLNRLGYGDVAILAGGVAAWRDAGLEAYTGVNVYSKAFGEFVEHAYGTPRLSAKIVKQKLDAGEDIVVLDGRTLQEFDNFSIPGAHAIPNGELPYRAHDLIPSPDTLVVVNCAGRTRSIIGAQALINAGLPNQVVALENGTMAWLFEGYALNSGVENTAPKPSAAGLAKARESVARLHQRYGIHKIDRDGLQRFQAERDTRSLFTLDVRTREEYETGHLPGAAWAEGGQLVQATDQWIGTRGGRVVLADDAEGARAAITASWLIQLGFKDVFVYAIDPATEVLELGPEPARIAGAIAPSETIAPAALQQRLAQGATLIDLSDSPTYAAGHIPGAHFAIRSRLSAGIARLPGAGAIIVTAERPVLAQLAAADLHALTEREILVLDGGNPAWRAAGLPIETGHTHLLDAAEDVWLSPYHQPDRFAAFQRYLDWEIDLVNQIKRDKTVSFQHFAAA